MSEMTDKLKKCATPDELWDMREEIVKYIETLESQNQTLVGVVDELTGVEE